MDNKNLTIALIIGGASGEREVSKSSSLNIFKALKNNGFRIKLVDPAYGAEQPENEDDFFSNYDWKEISEKNYLSAIDSNLFDDVDLAFLGLHGRWGEDGTIQSLLEMRRLKYTGSGVLASALAMDKNMSKITFRHYGINTPDWIYLERNNTDFNQLIKKIESSFGFPCIVKPNDEGSTIGLTLCKSPSELPAAISFARKFSDYILIEQYIKGYEITVGIVGGQALPALRIIPKHEIYDYECKYQDGMSEYQTPAKLPDDVFKSIQKQAKLACESIGCRNYGRVDFLVTKDFNSYCLEANTLPGMTTHSLLPMMANAAGIGFDDLINRIVINALK